MGSQTIMLNAVVIGSIMFELGKLEAADLHRWQEGAEIALQS